jgi:ferrous iron transport protein A
LIEANVSPCRLAYCEPVAISPPIWQRGFMTLDLLPIGQRARIIAVDWSQLASEEARRLQALGLEEGARVAISYRGVFGGRDPLAVMVGRMSVAIRRAHAAAMQVEVL